jgi:protein involved in temperature-dependent protein secretion
MLAGYSPMSGRCLLLTRRGQVVAITLGIQEQWHEPAASGQTWAGYRIVAISDEDVAQLHRWLAAH